MPDPDIGSSRALSESFILQQQQFLQAGLDKLVRTGRVPGVSVVITVEGKRISGHSGFADLQLRTPFSDSSRFEISCLMKFFASLLMLELHRENLVDLEAPIGTYLEDLKVVAHEKAAAIQVQHLSTHTSGFRGTDISQLTVRAGYNWSKLLEFMRDTRQLFPPGTVFNYEHTEHVILGEIIRRITGQTVHDRLLDTLFFPVNVTPLPAILAKKDPAKHVVSYTKNVSGQLVPVPANPPAKFWETSLSSLTISFQELASICEAILAKQVFPKIPNLLDLLQTAIIKTPPGVARPDCEQAPETFGLCCAQYQSGVIGHNFSTFGQACALRIIPEKSAAVLVGTNTWAPQERDRIVQWIISSFIENVRGPCRNNIAAFELFGGFSMPVLEGTYWGSYSSMIDVEFLGDKLQLWGRRGKSRSLMCEIIVAQDGCAHVLSDIPVPIGFFGDPIDVTPCLAIGLNTYKRVIN